MAPILGDEHPVHYNIWGKHNQESTSIFQPYSFLMNTVVTFSAQDGLLTNTSSTYYARVFARIMKNIKINELDLQHVRSQTLDLIPFCMH